MCQWFIIATKVLWSKYRTKDARFGSGLNLIDYGGGSRDKFRMIEMMDERKSLDTKCISCVSMFKKTIFAPEV